MFLECLTLSSPDTYFLFRFVVFSLFLKSIITRLNAAINGASSLLDFYYSVGGLVLIKVMNECRMLVIMMHFVSVHAI